MYKYLFITCLIVSVFSVLKTNGQGSWELSKNKDGIKIYTRSVENSDIKEFKAITVVNSTIEKLEKLIDKIDAYTSWQANISSVKILKVVNENECYVYTTSKIPWPIKDRDIITYSKKSKGSDGSLTYNYSCKPKYLEEKPDYIRINDSKGFWKLTPIENGQVKVIYQFYGDPEGSVPDWIINMFLVDGPFETMTNLKKIINN